MRWLLDLCNDSPAIFFGAVVAGKAAVPLVAAALANMALRRRSAALRHMVWMSALLGSLAVPVLSWTLPGWRIPIAASAPDRAPVAPAPAFPGNAAGSNRENLKFEISNLKFQESALGIRPTPATVPTRAPVDWVRRIRTAWIIGAACALLPPVVGAVGLLLLARRVATVSDPALVEQARELSAAIGLHRRVRLLQSSDAAMPMTWGWFRPTVLLPAEFGTWSEERQRVVLLHELGHIKRFDCLTQHAAQFAAAIYWFNPLTWLAAHRMRVERERACDDLVLLAGARPSDYARHLLTIARTLQSPGIAGAAAVAMARRSQLESRILSILDPRLRRGPFRFRGACLWLLGVAALVLPLSVVRLHAADRSDEAGAPGQGDGGKRTIVNGFVVDPAGKPVAGAQVAVLAKRKRTTVDRTTREGPDVLGTAQTDGAGHFSVSVPRIGVVQYWEPTALASMPGFGLGGVSFSNDTASAELKIALQPERVVRGRLVDIQGQPAPGVEVRVASVSTYGGRNDENSYGDEEPLQLGAPWPKRVTCDSEGRFTIPGLALNQRIQLAVRDDRYARQDFDLAQHDPAANDERTFSLGPPQTVEIRIVGEDNRRGIAGARVMVASDRGQPRRRAALGYVEVVADASGRATLQPIPGDSFTIAAYPPEGEPYLLRTKSITWPKASLKQEVEVALPVGVLVRGQITESPSGTPVAGARVFYLQPFENNPFFRDDGYSPWFGWGPDAVSGADGRFALAVSPGKGHLMIQGPSPDFLHLATTTHEVKPGINGNQRAYPDGLVKLDLKPAQKTHEVSVQLRRGVTVSGRVVDPDGRPVAEAVLFCRSYVPLTYQSSECEFSGDTIPVRDGQFELRGLDPEQSIPVFFFDVKNALGATVELSGKSAANGPVTVQLQKCGAARLRLVDKPGKLVAGAFPTAQIIVTPGGHFPGTNDTPMADCVYQSNLDRERHRNLKPDDQGTYTLPALIPGASYLLWSTYSSGRIDPIERTFKAEAGKTLELSDVIVRVPERQQ